MASAAMVTTMSAGAHAATDYTPTGGPSLNLVGTNVRVHFEEINQSFTCSRFDVAGQVTMPGVAREFGGEAVDLGALTDTCTNPLYGLSNFTAEPTWRTTVTGPSNGTSWPVRLEEVEMGFTAVNCVVEFEGTIDGAFDTATQRFTPGTSTLIVTYWSGSWCVTLDFQVGDHAVLQGELTNVPPAGSSPLTLS